MIVRGVEGAGVEGAGVGEAADLDRLIRRDQLEAVRRSVLAAIPVNGLLGLASALVALHAGEAAAGLAWFAVSTGVNALRIRLCRAPCPGLALGPGASPGEAAGAASGVERHLRLSGLAALLSGCVWACQPVLCAGYTSAQTLFYLAVTCGITAGAVTYGTAHARTPLAFIAPPLLCAAGCLLWAGGFDRACLAATVVLYLAALARAALHGEAAFRDASRLKNAATALARSRAEAHAQATRLAAEMTRRAAHDGLTGLLNRAGFLQRAGERLRADRLRGGAPCLMLLDLDGFKAVNDACGHETGDRVLAEVGARIRALLPAGGLAARLGGDEFALLYDADAAGLPYPALAAGLIAGVARPFAGVGAGRLGVSVGVCDAPGAGDDLARMLSCADAALYAAKAGGRNRFRLFDAGLRARMLVRRDAERDLPRALAAGEVEVWFQPIRAAGGLELAGLEALLRWRHPRHGWVPPGDVAAAAAAAGLTEALLRLVVGRACAMARTLRARGFEGVRVAVNVAPREVAQAPVDEIVAEGLRALGLPPAMLEVEIAEDAALDRAAVQDGLRALAAAGVGVALDEFGAGGASLSRLRRLRAGRVKIDRGLVTGLAACEDRRGLVQAVLGLGRLLGIAVVAEGVETREDLDVLRAMGCPFVQGDHLGRPMPPAAVEETLLRTPPAARSAAA